MNGIASLLFTGWSILISQPENGALVDEYSQRAARDGRSERCAPPVTRAIPTFTLR